MCCCQEQVNLQLVSEAVKDRTLSFILNDLLYLVTTMGTNGALVCNCKTFIHFMFADRQIELQSSTLG